MNVPFFWPVSELYNVSINASALTNAPEYFFQVSRIFFSFICSNVFLVERVLTDGPRRSQHLHIGVNIIEVRDVPVARNYLCVGRRFRDRLFHAVDHTVNAAASGANWSSTMTIPSSPIDAPILPSAPCSI